MILERLSRVGAQHPRSEAIQDAGLRLGCCDATCRRCAISWDAELVPTRDAKGRRGACVACPAGLLAAAGVYTARRARGCTHTEADDAAHEVYEATVQAVMLGLAAPLFALWVSGVL